MTPSHGTFPFGQPLRRVVQTGRSPKQVDLHQRWVRGTTAGVLQPGGSR